GELARRCDVAGAKRVAREVLRSSPSQAHHDVKSAERLGGLEEASGAVAPRRSEAALHTRPAGR
ncbi:MAG: hypothetical protein OXT07_04895, partial [bacterium]|nr:hypothetical protein [bacterium]